MAAAPVAAAEAVEEKTAFDVELTASGDNKIAVIKAIREFTDIKTVWIQQVLPGIARTVLV